MSEYERIADDNLKKVNLAAVEPLIELAVREDYGGGDPTSEITVGANETAACGLVTRETIVVCGMDVAAAVLKHYDPRLRLTVRIADGYRAQAGQTLATLEGPLRPMLSAERVVLNFLQRLCGVSTLTAKYVAAIAGTNAKIYDTRKTTPGWRELEKYAVRCGGGCNHRMHLADAVMFKDNHIAQLGADFVPALTGMVTRARAVKGVECVVVEVDSVDEQLPKVLTIPGVDIILLDNMTPRELKHAVELRNKRGNTPLLEASGGVSMETVTAVASTGIDRISIGAITHSAAAVDIGLDR